MKWNNIDIKTETGEIVKAQAPVIVSASRSTDIPTFYSDWFINRLKKGYLKWKNPFNGKFSYVSFDKTRIIVFWSKNPKPMMKHLDYLDEIGMNYYFQFTLNDYVKEGIEKKVGSVDKRIEKFIELSERIGKEKVIWRFDPYILTETSDVEELLNRTEFIGNKLHKYTNRMVFSFADIKTYKKVQNNMRKSSVKYLEFNERTMNELAQGLMRLNQNWNIEIGTCAEMIDLDQYGIIHNKCVDDDLMVKLFSHDKELMDFIGYRPEPIQTSLFEQIDTKNNEPYKYKIKKDKGQRELCGCIMSKDIGQYNTCPHECIYCYANTSIEIAKQNYNKHKINPNSETIIGE
jgi:DNA repair photolyase